MKWQNPYIDRLLECPDLIIGSSALTLSAGEKDRVTFLISQFPRLFVELGSGSGGHLLEQAQLDQQALFLGFELRFKRVVRTAEKARKLNLPNVVVLRTTAQNISSILPLRSIDGVYINFPDPWDRHRWHKHRLIQAESLKVLETLMKPGSFISYKTDHRESFGATSQILRSNGAFLIGSETTDLYGSIYGENQIKSEFEKLFISKGLPIYYLKATLISQDNSVRYSNNRQR